MHHTTTRYIGYFINRKFFQKVVYKNDVNPAEVELWHKLAQQGLKKLEDRLSKFTFFGGVTEIVVPDCLKAAVVKCAPWTPTVNASYQSWADHYGAAVIPTRVRKPYAQCSDMQI